MALGSFFDAPAGSVRDGPRHHRHLVRRLGPFVPIGIALALGLVAAMLLVGSESAWRGAPGFILAVASIPTLPLFGVPVMGGTTRWVSAIVTSLALWYGIGTLASRRSTSRVVTSWPEWRREYVRLSVGVWVGALVGLAVAVTVLSVNL
ncbi:MAG: hypothetical protein FJW09_09585 [Actinobacteria bacterium]|nr:hypothetical protein [Actinomycetota bacterium]